MRVTKAGGRGNGTSSMAGYIGVTGTVAEEPLIPKPQSWYKVMFPQASGLVTKAFRLTEFEVLSSAKKKKWNFEGTKNNSRRVQGGSAPYAQTAKPAALKVVKKRGAARRGKVRLQVACCSLSRALYSLFSFLRLSLSLLFSKAFPFPPPHHFFSNPATTSLCVSTVALPLPSVFLFDKIFHLIV